MPTLSCYVDHKTLAILHKVAAETGRAVDELAEAAISEAALKSQQPRSPTRG
jgi:hypothetical protein